MRQTEPASRKPAKSLTARPLSERERRFVEAFMGDAKGNASEAARLAGYSPRRAKETGSELVTKRNVAEAIAARQANDPAVATREELHQTWTAFSRDPAQHPQYRLKAGELLARTNGWFLDRHEVTGKDGGPLESMSVTPTPELRERVLALLEKFPTP